MEVQQGEVAVFVELADRLRAERKRVGLTQAELAALGGVAGNTQNDYENADKDRVPNAKYLNAIASSGIDVGYVVTGRRSAGIPESDDQLITRLRGASPIDRQTIDRVIDAILEDRRGVSVNPADNLPEELLLKQMFGTLLSSVKPGSNEEQTAHFLARNLEPALRALEGDWEIRIDPDYRPEEDAPQQRRA